MFIDCYPNNGKPYLRVVESFSIVIDGERKNRRRVIMPIGPVSRFDDGKPDYIERLRQSFREGKPIINCLEGLVASRPAPCKVSVEFDRNDPTAAFLAPKNIGYFILDAMYDALGIYDVLNKYKSNSRIEYDLNGHAKALVFGRVLSPDSKCATWQKRDAYLFDVVSTKNVIEVYRALDVLDEQSGKIQQRMNTKIEKHIGRSKRICFYDVTNYWFEIDDPDDDFLSESGEVIKPGLRKSGPSKAKNRKPIVQMGLFIDDNGIPVSYKIFPGNHIDQTTLRPAMKETLSKMGYERAVIIADGGLNSAKNLAHIVSQKNGYIVSKSAKGQTNEMKSWILDEEGYEWTEKKTFKVKSKIRTRIVKDENEGSVELTEKLISYWSKKQHDRAMHENRKFIEYLKSAIEHPDKLKDKQPKIKKYLVETRADKETGEVVDAVSILSLDTDKIQRDLDLMGYYTLITSELDMDEHEVIDKYHGLSRIEDSFRVIKSELEGRPVYVQTESHINAHFLICFIALTMIRILQYKILAHEGEITNSTRKWKMGVPAERIKEALDGFMADAQPSGFYKLSMPNDDLLRILDAIGVNATLALPTESELRQLKYAFDKAFLCDLKKYR
jgi:transposase